MGWIRAGKVTSWGGGLPRGWLALRPEVASPGLSLSGLQEGHLSLRCPPNSSSCPDLFHPADGYATVDRRERRTLGSDSTGDTSEKELLKVSGSEQVPREASCFGLVKRTAMSC